MGHLGLGQGGRDSIEVSLDIGGEWYGAFSLYARGRIS
jgi:hypothetical protein